ncbi:uncharacterized protein EI90DRAFT_3291035 [Cantharellus anzutake]|uniref:uncharacterized protein n=1 Tax=Cantharellus anzutake TaxID=1750568 RepID=UPI0019065809|nr:uncharacterized protein EI90DRAFT_3291035 [Cantharellus anzutake]KAF8327157.1 hypothetical protein EI90DRAFT_3291035 [Cantharellus anzutake]
MQKKTLFVPRFRKKFDNARKGKTFILVQLHVAVVQIVIQAPSLMGSTCTYRYLRVCITLVKLKPRVRARDYMIGDSGFNEIIARCALPPAAKSFGTIKALSAFLVYYHSIQKAVRNIMLRSQCRGVAPLHSKCENAQQQQARHPDTAAGVHNAFAYASVETVKYIWFQWGLYCTVRQLLRIYDLTRDVGSSVKSVATTKYTVIALRGLDLGTFFFLEGVRAK